MRGAASVGHNAKMDIAAPVEVTSFRPNMEWKLSSNNKYHPRKRWRCEWIRIWRMDRKTGWRTIARIAEPANWSFNAAPYDVHEEWRHDGRGPNVERPRLHDGKSHNAGRRPITYQSPQSHRLNLGVTKEEQKAYFYFKVEWRRELLEQSDRLGQGRCQLQTRLILLPCITGILMSDSKRILPYM